MEKYLWKYVDKIDDKIEHISDILLEKVDKYVLGEVQQNEFELSDDEGDGDGEKKDKKDK